MEFPWNFHTSFVEHLSNSLTTDEQRQWLEDRIWRAACKRAMDPYLRERLDKPFKGVDLEGQVLNDVEYAMRRAEEDGTAPWKTRATSCTGQSGAVGGLVRA